MKTKLFNRSAHLMLQDLDDIKHLIYLLECAHSQLEKNIKHEDGEDPFTQRTLSIVEEIIHKLYVKYGTEGLRTFNRYP